MVDAAIALVLYGLLLTTLDLPGRPGGIAGPGWPHVVGAAMTMPLAFRRSAPVLVLGVVTAAAVGFQVLQPANLVVAMATVALAIHTVGVDGRAGLRDRARVGAVATVAAAFGWMVVTVDVTPFAWPPRVAMSAVFLGGGWVTGEQTRRAREQARDLAERTAELERERELRAHHAVVAERLRIARELHDVVGHHVSVMGVQAAGAERILDRDPDRARSALQTISSSSRRAVAEMQRVLALLRTDDTTPRPSLARLGELVDDVRAAGLDVRITQQDCGELPASVDLAATRVVQEALTNAVRHAGAGTTVEVQVQRGAGAVEIVVEDDGAGTPHPLGQLGGGQGLAGLRERVALHGGRFSAAPLPGRGYRVTATIPLHAADTAAHPPGVSVSPGRTSPTS